MQETDLCEPQAPTCEVEPRMNRQQRRAEASKARRKSHDVAEGDAEHGAPVKAEVSGLGADERQAAVIFPQLVRFLRRPEVERITGLGRSTIYAKVVAGEFPKPVPLSGGAVGWLESEIAEWQAQRIAEREKVASA